MAPIHFPLAMQGGALLAGQGQYAGVGGGIQAVGMQHFEAALGLGADVIAHGEVDGLGGHVGYFVGAEQPQIHVRVVSAEVGQARQQPVAGKGGRGVEHQLIGLAVLPQPAYAH